MQEIGQKRNQLGELRREVETNRNHYETLFKRFKETMEKASLKEATIRFVDRANHPIAPVKPKKTHHCPNFPGRLAVWGHTGLFGGLSGHDDQIARRCREQAGCGDAGIGPSPPYKIKKEESDKLNDVSKMTQVFPNSLFSEAVRTGLVLSALDSPRNSWLITSSISGEGKSTLAINLALSMAQMNIGKVLLIDADLRKPSLMKRFDTLPTGSLGLAHALSKTADIKDCIHSAGDNIDLMPAGLIPPNPLELLSSKVFASLLEE